MGDNTYTSVWNSGTMDDLVYLVATGDQDKDGNGEIIIPCRDGKVYLFENTGDNTYQEVWNSGNVMSGLICGAATGDQDGDGMLEIIATSWADKKVYVFEVLPTSELTTTSTELAWCSPVTCIPCEYYNTWTRDGIEIGVIHEKIHPYIGKETHYQFFIGHSWEYYDNPWTSVFEKGTIVVVVPEDVEINYEGITFCTAAGSPTGPRGWYAYEQPEEDECAEAALKGIIGQLPIGFIGNIFGFAFTVEEINEKCNSEYEYDWLEDEIKNIDKNEYDIIIMPWRADDSYGVNRRSGVNLVLPLTFERDGWITYYYQFWHDGELLTSSGSVLIEPVVDQAAKEVPASDENGIPGFEPTFAIAGLLAAAYLLRRKG